jgi:hypothetical protein
MTWFKVDDSFYDHPKVFDAPDCAVALWTRAGSWSARNLTDGFVPAGMPARLCDDPETAVKELVRRGLWARTSGGYRFHNWAEFQPSREDVEAERKSARERMRNLRQQRKASGLTANGSPSVRPNTSRTHAERSGEVRNPRPDPSRRDGGTGRSLGELPPPRSGSNPPSPRCEQHLDVDDPPPCGPCADARRSRARWDIADSERRRTQPQCRTHRGQPAHNCGPCRADALVAAQEVS